MRRKLFGLLLAVSAVALFVPAFADEGGAAPEIKFHGEVRARWEYLDNFTDFDSDVDDTFDFTPYRVRVGMDAIFNSRVEGHIEIQNFGAFGNGFPLTTPGIDDPIFQSLPGQIGTNETRLYQGYFVVKEVFTPNLSLSVGRQEHTEGNELHMGDGDFYNGLSFDGIRAMYDAEKWNMDVFWYTLQERSVLPGSIFGGGGFPVDGGSNDLTFSGVTLDFDIADNGQKIEPYLLYIHDGNIGAPKFWTLGALYHRPPSQDRAMDWSIEIAAQSGDIGSGPTAGDLSASVAEGWFGYSWGDTARHRVHIGAFVSSDGVTTGNDSEAFIPLFPDAHRRLGSMDMFTPAGTGAAAPLSCTDGGLGAMDNLTSLNLGYDWTSGAHRFGGAVHQFLATEDFGCTDDDYGQELDLTYNYTLTPNFGIEIGSAMFMAGDQFGPASGITDNAFSANDDSAMRAWVQGRLRF